MDTVVDVLLENVDDEIKGAIHTLQAASMPIKMSNIVSQLSSYIINIHDGQTSLFTYKGTLTKRIANVLIQRTLHIQGIPQIGRESGWFLYNKKLGIAHDTTIRPAINYTSDIETRSREPSTITDTISHSEISTLTDSMSPSTNSSSSTKQSKLTSKDKDNIKKIYEDLDPNKTWRLFTGIVVEKKMEEFALACNYEHPVHSLIFDTSDKSWLSYFTKEEMEEIVSFKPKKLDKLPDTLNSYMEDLKKLDDIETLKKKLAEETGSSSCEWIRCTILEYMKLFKYQYLPLSDQTEEDTMRRIWFFIDTVFDASSIHCRG